MAPMLGLLLLLAGLAPSTIDGTRMVERSGRPVATSVAGAPSPHRPDQALRQGRNQRTAEWWGWLSAAGYASIVPLVVGATLTERAGRKRLARGLRAGLVVAPTVAALVPVLAATPLPLARQAFPDTHEYADVARHLVALDGFVTTVHGGEPHPSRYPPGFPLVLAPFAAIGGDYPTGAQLGARAFAVFYLLAAVGTAWGIGGPLAGGLAATLVGLSPFARQSAATIMSDALTAGLTVALAGLIHRCSRDGAALAGLLGGAIAVLRLSAFIHPLALVLAAPRRLLPRVMLFAAPSIVGLALFHWLVFGSPLRTGYDYWLPGARSFDLAYALDSGTMRDGPLFADALGGRLVRWACPCPPAGPQAALPHVAFYPAVLLGLYWVFAPPLATLPGLAFAWRRRRWPSARFTLWLTALSLALYSVYFYQGTRFLAGPATLLAVFTAVWAAELFARVAQRLLGSPVGGPVHTWRSRSCG